MEISFNQAAFIAVTAGSLCSFGAVAATVTATSAIGMAFFGSLALISSGCTIGSVIAWFQGEEEGAKGESYFKSLPTHIGTATAGVFTTVSQIFFTAVVEGFAKAIGDSIYCRIRKQIG